MRSRSRCASDERSDGGRRRKTRFDGAEGDPAGDSNRTWVRTAWEALKPYSTGGNYVNFQTDDEADELTVESYRNNYERLGSVKATYDPSNLFRVNRTSGRSVHSSGSPVARCRFADRLMQPADLRLGPRPS